MKVLPSMVKLDHFLRMAFEGPWMKGMRTLAHGKNRGVPKLLFATFRFTNLTLTEEFNLKIDTRMSLTEAL